MTDKMTYIACEYFLNVDITLFFHFIFLQNLLSLNVIHYNLQIQLKDQLHNRFITKNNFYKCNTANQLNFSKND